jgi:DNA-binding HxlR family transcriptional regulator
MRTTLSHSQLVTLYRGFFVLGDSANLKILYELDKYGERNFTQLKIELGINPATLSKKLRLLIEVGLIESDKTHNNLHVYYSIVQHQRSVKRFLEAFDKLAEEL